MSEDKIKFNLITDFSENVEVEAEDFEALDIYEPQERVTMGDMLNQILGSIDPSGDFKIVSYTGELPEELKRFTIESPPSAKRD
jgi:hypothetical protein